MDDLPAAGGNASESTHQRVLAAMMLFGFTTLVAKFIALGRDLLVARQLGAGDELDAYFIATILPSYAVVVLAQTFGSGFIPTYVHIWRRDGLLQAQHLAGGMLTLVFLALLVVTLAIAVATPRLPFVGLELSEAKLGLARGLTYWVIGMVGISGLSAVLAAVLNAHEWFLPVALAPAMIPLGTLAVFGFWAGSAGVYALAAGTLVGFAAESLLLAIFAWWKGLFPWPRLPRRDRAVVTIGRQYLPVMLAALLMSSSLVIDQSMAASLQSGDVSILNYGGKVVAVVLSVVAVSMSTVLFPRFTHLIASGRMTELVRTFVMYAGGIVLLSLPGVALLTAFGEPLMRALFERGAFTAETTAAASRVQLWLLPQIPFYVVVMLGTRVLSALDANAAVLRVSAVNIVVNVAGNYLLMRAFGVAGIAMATSLMYVIATVTTLLAIRARVRELRQA